jgi:DNA polymerase-3 subunit alpha
MPQQQFVHLHVHSEFSLLDGAGQIKDLKGKDPVTGKEVVQRKGLVSRAKDLGMPALALTDHGNMYGAVKFYLEAKAKDIKPIIGCEFYMAARTRFDRQGKIDARHQHLTLLARNEQGYKNLIKLASIASLEGFYYKPRIDWDVLQSHAAGLVALSGCMEGPIAQKVMENTLDEAKKNAAKLRDIFGTDLYLEIQDLGLVEQKRLIPGLVTVARDMNIPLVATNDVHYINREDAEAQDVLLCIGTGELVANQDRLKFLSDQMYLKSPAEMAELFKELPEALSSTLEIAEKCDFQMETGRLQLPRFKVPEGQTAPGFLRQLCEAGLPARYKTVTPDIQKRLEYELAVIEKMGYAEYFLIVQDFVNYAKSQGIPVGPGRGSAAGSLVSYALQITDLDPLRYKLLFERFLNPERVSMPDIDIDFCYVRRPEVLSYVSKKYGEDHVAQIVTFNTMAARGAIRDVGRVQNIPLNDVDKIAKMVPESIGITLEEALALNPDLKTTYQNTPYVRKLIDVARKIEGLSRNAGTHAAGVVISEKPLTDIVPVQKMNDQVQTQYAMEDLEKLGLLKMDFLGLRTLTMLQDSLRMVEQNHKQKINFSEMGFDDRETYQLLSRGETSGLFQLESKGMQGLIKDIQPRVFEDLIAILALYRPGPLGSGMMKDFINNKEGKTKVKYELPVLEPILKETYGLIVYQEQVMQIASALGGFSLGEADIMRRAMGKKKPEEMQKLREKFIAGAVARNFPRDVAERVFALCEKFAEYGFNKSHSAAYAVLSYQTAYLKTHYPLEFMAALLTSISGDTDKVSEYIAECNRMGIEVLPPDINESGQTFTVVRGSIRFGLGAIKNVGEGAIKNIIEARNKDGSFLSLGELCMRVDLRTVNKKVIESMIKSGALDHFGTRAALFSIFEATMEWAVRLQRERESGQVSLFGDSLSDNAVFAMHDTLPDVPEWPAKEKLKMEKELLGLYISDHPLRHLDIPLETLITDTSFSLKEKQDGAAVAVAGMLKDIRRMITKTNKNMIVGKLEDLRGDIPLVLFPGRSYDEYNKLFEEDNVVLIHGRARLNRDEKQVICEKVELLTQQHQAQVFHVELEAIEDPKLFEGLKKVFLEFRGETPVILHTREATITAGKQYWIRLKPEFTARVVELVGEGRSWVG